jgi:deoxyribodipyrimidine photo-lyase
MTNLLWIKNDLRLEDNTALIKAIDDSVKYEEKLLIVFLIDPDQLKPGQMSHDYFFKSLDYFYRKLKKIGLDIYFMYGDFIEAFKRLIKDFPDIRRVYYNSDETGYGYFRDNQVYKIFRNASIDCFGFMDKHLHQAKEILTSNNTNYKVFTPYYLKWKDRAKNLELTLDYNKIKLVSLEGFQEKDYYAKEIYLNIIKNIKNDFDGLIGEEYGRENLSYFVNENLVDYDKTRDYPYLNSTSHISYYLSTGQLSIRTVYSLVSRTDETSGKNIFIKELAWRDFFNMIHHFNPNQKEKALNENYNSLEWVNDENQIETWKNGKTGYPIVDAAMRQLNKEGYIHNRLRMIVASFLVKDLLVDWRIGEKYFSDKLIDYDSSSNIGNWQWAASVGTDAVPYFRIFNPVSQSMKFDKDGIYIKKYVKELDDLPYPYIHQPYKYKDKIKSEFGIEIDKLYPKPIVEHSIQRQKAIEMFRKHGGNI